MEARVWGTHSFQIGIELTLSVMETLSHTLVRLSQQAQPSISCHNSIDGLPRGQCIENESAGKRQENKTPDPESGPNSGRSYPGCLRSQTPTVLLSILLDIEQLSKYISIFEPF